MIKATFTAPYTIEYSEVDIPKISQDQVLLKITKFGVCGSDIQIYHGQHKFMRFPVVPGHEACAIVESVGENVKGFKRGDKVAINPRVSCGECYPCEIGRFNVCENLKVLGVHKDGFACEYFAVEQKHLYLCKSTMSEEEIALVEPVAVAFGSLMRAKKIRNQNVVVVGAGTIGNLVAQCAKAMGAAHIMVTDINQKKLDYAQKCEVEFCVNTKNETLKAAIERVFGKRKADVIIDCAATPSAFEAILEASRPSSQIIVTGNFKQAITLEFPKIQRREIDIIGHMMYDDQDFKQALDFVANKKINLEGFITQRYDLKNLKYLFNFIEENPNEIMKALVVI